MAPPRMRGLLLLIALLLACSCAASTLRGTVLLNTFEAWNNTLLYVRPATGEVRSAGLFPQDGYVFGGVLDSYRKIYYVMSALDNYYYYLTALNVSNPDSAQVLFTTHLANLYTLDNIQCDWTTGMIWGVGGDENSFAIVRVDPITGKFQNVVKLPTAISMGVGSSAFDQDKRTFMNVFTWEDGSSTLYQISAANGNIKQAPMKKSIEYTTYDTQQHRVLAHIMGSNEYSVMDTDTGNFTPLIKNLGGIATTMALDPEGGVVHAIVVNVGPKYSLNAFDIQTGALLRQIPLPDYTRFAAFRR